MGTIVQDDSILGDLREARQGPCLTRLSVRLFPSCRQQENFSLFVVDATSP